MRDLKVASGSDWFQFTASKPASGFPQNAPAEARAPRGTMEAPRPHNGLTCMCVYASTATYLLLCAR